MECTRIYHAMTIGSVQQSSVLTSKVKMTRKYFVTKSQIE